MPDELQNIKALEEELRELQKIEIGIKSNDSRRPIQNVTNSFAIASSLYTDPDKLQAMIDTLNTTLDNYTKQGYRTGKLLSLSNVEKYLKKSEMADYTQRQLRVLAGASKSQAKRRMNIAFEELNREKGVLKSEIKLFKMRARLTGESSKDTLKRLVISGRNQNGPVQGFAKALKQITIESIRREKSAGEIDQYLKVYPPNLPWQWISISTTPCPECQARAGRVLTYNEWLKLGIPGTGRTICGFACRCKLIPVPIADKKFPTVKTFRWKPNDMVIATSSEIKKLQKATRG